MYGRGISHEGEIIDLGIKYDIVKRSGAWISYNDEKIAQGRDNAKAYIAEHPELAKEIEDKIREKLAEAPASQKKGKAAAEEAAAPAAAPEEAPAAETPAKRRPKISIDVDVE